MRSMRPETVGAAAAGELSLEDFEFIRRLVFTEAGISLGPEKRSLVVHRLLKRVRQLGLESLAAYCAFLRNGRNPEERVVLIDLLTTNVTHFFREPAHFEFVAREILVRHWHGNTHPGRPFLAWSAACSTGEEPYSLALLLAEHERKQPGFQWRVEATDISTRVLAKAQQAIYAEEDLQLPDPTWRSRYFQRGIGQWDGYWRIKSELQRRVRFQRWNLLQVPYPLPGLWDLIFCRNVMIYFEREVQRAVVMNLIRQLQPGGYLIVGHSESLLGLHARLRPIQPSVYQYAPG